MSEPEFTPYSPTDFEPWLSAETWAEVIAERDRYREALEDIRLARAGYMLADDGMAWEFAVERACQALKGGIE